MIDILKVNIDKELLKKYYVWQNTSMLGLIYPLDNICIVSDRPNKIKMLNGLLHADGESAVSYLDGLEIWVLNGVRVTKEVAETPREKINPKIVLEEKNAEVRKEIIKKIGLNRVVKQLGAKSIQKNEIYELINFDVIDGRFRPYLKMLNPSTGEYHIEGVHPDCNTIEKALAWRDGEEIYQKPIVLT